MTGSSISAMMARRRHNELVLAVLDGRQNQDGSMRLIEDVGQRRGGRVDGLKWREDRVMSQGNETERTKNQINWVMSFPFP